jgi:LmbE family N-acetylglucosaminyl deacetylase
MSKLVISPHSDDAIFSIGGYIATFDRVTILSPLMGTPEDEIGKKKHTVLNQEHAKACDLIGAHHIDGDFLDDVYPGIDEAKLEAWIMQQIELLHPDEIYIPVGIHHPDHVRISNILIKNIKQIVSVLGEKTRIFFYDEHPYSLNYRILANSRLDDIEKNFHAIRSDQSYGDKEKKQVAVNCYFSQISKDGVIDEELVDKIMYMERIHEVKLGKIINAISLHDCYGCESNWHLTNNRKSDDEIEEDIKAIIKDFISDNDVPEDVRQKLIKKIDIL